MHANSRASNTNQCQPPENAQFEMLVETHDFGPVRATGIRPAITALPAIIDDIQREKPEVYPLSGSAGMLCCRLVTGSASSVSNHAWGIAIDLTIGGHLDIPGASPWQCWGRAASSI